MHERIRNMAPECFTYQRPPVIIPPCDYLDMDLALNDAFFRKESENLEISMLNDSVMGKLMEYALMVES